MKTAALLLALGMIAFGIHQDYLALAIIGAIYLAASLILIRLDVVKDHHNAALQAGTDSQLPAQGVTPSRCA